MNDLAPETKILAQQALQANKDHQYSLKVYTERLDAELQSIEKLLAAADVSDNEEEFNLDVGGEVVIPTSVRATGLVASAELLAHSSPFYTEASRRQRYVDATVIHPMKGPELEALSEAVRSENHRIHALEAQQRGEEAFRSLEGRPRSYFEQNTAGINWERVAQKVSSSGSGVKRTAKECEIRWLGERHPRFNHNAWTQSELDRLKDLVGDAAEGQVDWVDIATRLGTDRMPVDCMRHAITRRVHMWTPEADAKLLEAVKIYGTDNWLLVARTISEDATAAQCQNRYMRTLDPSIRRGAWTEEEDAQLKRAAKVFGHSWIEIAAFIPGRNNEQCRDRFQEHLNPKITRGKWSEDQDRELLQAYDQVGGPKWREISQVLSGTRTDNMCRSRYNVLMKLKGKGSKASFSGVTPAPPTDATPAETPSPIEQDMPPAAGPSRPRPRPRLIRKSNSAVTPGGPGRDSNGQSLTETAATLPEGDSQPADGEAAESGGYVDAAPSAAPPIVTSNKGKGKPTAQSRAPKPTKRKTSSIEEKQTSAKRQKRKGATNVEGETPTATSGARLSSGRGSQNDASSAIAEDAEDTGTQANDVDQASPPARGERGRGRGRRRGRGQGRGAARGRPAKSQKNAVPVEDTAPSLPAAGDGGEAIDAGPPSASSTSAWSKEAAGNKSAKPHVEPTRRMPVRAAARRSATVYQDADAQ